MPATIWKSLESEVLAALCLDARLQCSIIVVDVSEVTADAHDRLFEVVAGIEDAILVLVRACLAQVDQVAVKVSHVSVLHLCLANFNLVWVRVRFVHPFVFEAVGSRVFHCLVAHVLERSGEDAIDLIYLVLRDVVWRLAWRTRVIHGLVVVLLLAILLIEHFLEDGGGELLSGHL